MNMILIQDYNKSDKSWLLSLHMISQSTQYFKYRESFSIHKATQAGHRIVYSKYTNITSTKWPSSFD